MVFPMISSKKLAALARKWKTMTGIRRRISIPRINCKLARAYHFVVYYVEEGRFVVPLAYLRTRVFKELFRLLEEEFGSPKDGPITLPCDAVILEYVISLVERRNTEMLEKAFFDLSGSHQCYSTVAS
ncbi:indole-3-acetic acid-induced protein ARG7-like [Hibiscus syriacus]|uniref:Indole-3-acetic acid-induced protein ARG7-like n=1 Tax=Hibiscus syriacus TaxID=106335 RepID=A0A6A2XRH6_HIBSY|nr:auxin-responsive protein SAUR68-like [Hibiscus syriacus]KAE8656474.1 indole-3-acetic acid-induced protein ARG7-like [Hibiscus syriacus]